MSDDLRDKEPAASGSPGWMRAVRSSVWPAVRAWFAPERRKRYRAWIFQGYILASLIAFSFLTVFASVVTYFNFDLEFTLAIQKSIPSWFGSILFWVSWPGYLTGSVLTVASLALLMLLLGLRWETLMALATAGSAGVINSIIKFAIRRPRPDESLVDVFQQLTTYSFPSGHVMFYTAFFGFMAFLSFTMIKRGWLRGLLVSLFSLLVLLVGLSRIYLGEHWASDVIGAYLLGFLILIAAIQVYRWGQQRRITNTGGEEQNDL
jgi:membrane-associated phospholipid phosphatase